MLSVLIHKCSPGCYQFWFISVAQDVISFDSVFENRCKFKVQFKSKQIIPDTSLLATHVFYPPQSQTKNFFLLLFFKTPGGSCVIFIQLSYTLLVISADTRGRRFTLKGLKGDSVTRFFNSIYFPQVCQKNLAGVPFSVDDRKQIMCTEDYQK